VFNWRVVQIREADFGAQDLIDFMSAHRAEIRPTGPAESQHALDIAALRGPGMRVWVARDLAEVLVGTVALAPVSPKHEEIKSMRTAPQFRGRGVGRALVLHALADAGSRGVRRVSLETGSMEYFAPARALYRAVGFVECGPFGAYVPDPNSVFMTMELSQK
jgi:putative acetyltransferase